MIPSLARPRFIVAILLFWIVTLPGQPWQIVQNNENRLTVQVRYPGPSVAYELQPLFLTVGLPSARLPRITVDFSEVAPYTSSGRHPYDFDPPLLVVSWDRLDRFRDIHVGILKISPLIRDGDDLKLVSRVQCTVSFPKVRIMPKEVGKVEESLYRNRIVNWAVAKNWVRPPVKGKKRQPSFLPRGRWYRISVGSDGVYRLTANVLQAAGLNMEEIEPGSVSMFTNPGGGRPMSHTVGSQIPENLVEVAIRITGEGDGSFDDEDAIIFYGRGPRGFDSTGPGSVDFTQNPYTNANVYWLVVPDDSTVPGKRVATEAESDTNLLSLNYGISYRHLEEDLENPFDSGLLWVGAGFSRHQTVSLPFNLSRPDKDVDASISLTVFGGTTSDSEEHPSHKLRVYQGSANNNVIASASWSGLDTRTITADLDRFLLDDGPNIITLENVSDDAASKIHIDWATLTYGRELTWEDDPMEFFAPPNISYARFFLSNVTLDIDVWDITDFTDPVEQTLELVGSRGFFEKSLPSSRMARFIAFIEEDIPEVEDVTPDEDQTFSILRREIDHSVDHIIIAPAEFSGPAEKLQKHRTNSIVAPLETIYDEFSGGVQDPLAIRYFLKWTKEYWRDPSTNSFPTFVLLFGDGDYDYRNITGASHNLVPTFQSRDVRGSSSDDRFVYLDGRVPEMSVGRFPAVSVKDASNMVDKTIAYESDPKIGLWRRRITLIADDFARPNFGPIELTHTKNSEEIARMIPRSLKVQKIYMEDFPEINDGSQYGVTKPDATEALFDLLERGTTILNYIGHGSAYQWAQEGLLTSARGDLSSINTSVKLPIWIAATCSWGRYDNVEGSAMSEDILRLRENGAVAAISTTGLITFSANREFALKLFRSFFPGGKVTDEPLGAVYSSIKDGSTGSELFHLFGDPALKLALTANTVAIDTVSPDTLVALERGSFSGHLEEADPSQGEGYAVLHDADRTVTKTYEENGYREVVTYAMTGRPLFRGLVPFSAHRFQGQFIVPKDISYETSDGRLSVYLYADSDDGLWEGLGLMEGLVLAGGTGNPVDSEGPLISFAMEDRLVEWGDHVPEDGELLVKISDPLGVNMTGEVGHAIRLWIDDDETNARDLTESFVYDPGSYRSGFATFPLSDLLRGESLLTVEAWDNANNRGKQSIALIVSPSDELLLTNIYNYPNPFRQNTQFAFEVSRRAWVSIKIFTLTGELVRELDPGNSFVGYSHINWNGRDDFGDEIAYGAYLYQVTAEPVEGGKKVTRIRKIAKSP